MKVYLIQKYGWLFVQQAKHKYLVQHQGAVEKNLEHSCQFALLLVQRGNNDVYVPSRSAALLIESNYSVRHVFESLFIIQKLMNFKVKL